MSAAPLASDAEREACALRLRDAAAEGRLDIAELDRRLGLAFAARTRLDLATLTADLPAPVPQRSGTRRWWWPKSAVWGSFVVVGGAVNLLLLGLWIVDVGAMRNPVLFGITQFDVPWPLIPLAVWAGAIAAVNWSRRRISRERGLRRLRPTDGRV
jgi:uncharacterized protein DUF1707